MFENENEDALSELAYDMTSVVVNNWKDNIDSNVPEAFADPPSSNHHLRPSSYVTFCEAINLRGDISKISMSIRSFNVYSEHCSIFDSGKLSFSK